MNRDLDFDWLDNPKATLNLLGNVLAGFAIAFLMTLPDPALPWRSRVSRAGTTAAVVAYAKLSKRPIDVAATDLARQGLNPGRRAEDRVLLKRKIRQQDQETT